tara:strand:+ start:1329 stop:1688 length:360 start_codon:yes stop_codon:yes gene_type:complete
MEVKIQYTVALEDIPKETLGLLPACEDYKDRITNLESLIDEHSFSLAIDEIESIRRSMYKTDQRLADCQAILTGYLNVKNAPPEESPPQNNLDFDLEQLKGLASIVQPQEQVEENDPAS